MLEPINKIEITPMVGVALILVIIFVVTSPIINAPPMKKDVQLPKATTVQAHSKVNILITYAEDGELAINDEKIPKKLLISKIQDILKKNHKKLVIIRADKHVLHKDILALLSAVKKSGAENIAIATEQKSRLDI